MHARSAGCRRMRRAPRARLCRISHAASSEAEKRRKSAHLAFEVDDDAEPAGAAGELVGRPAGLLEPAEREADACGHKSGAARAWKLSSKPAGAAEEAIGERQCSGVEWRRRGAPGTVGADTHKGAAGQTSGSSAFDIASVSSSNRAEEHFIARSRPITSENRVTMSIGDGAIRLKTYSSVRGPM